MTPPSPQVEDRTELQWLLSPPDAHLGLWAQLPTSPGQVPALCTCPHLLLLQAFPSQERGRQAQTLGVICHFSQALSPNCPQRLPAVPSQPLVTTVHFC